MKLCSSLVLLVEYQVEKRVGQITVVQIRANKLLRKVLRPDSMWIASVTSLQNRLSLQPFLCIYAQSVTRDLCVCDEWSRVFEQAAVGIEIMENASI